VVRAGAEDAADGEDVVAWMAAAVPAALACNLLSRYLVHFDFNSLLENACPATHSDSYTDSP